MYPCTFQRYVSEALNGVGSDNHTSLSDVIVNGNVFGFDSRLPHSKDRPRGCRYKATRNLWGKGRGPHSSTVDLPHVRSGR